MSDDRKERIEQLLAELLDVPAPDRPRVLELACGTDAELRCEVESLARAFDEGQEFFVPSTSAGEADISQATAGTRVGRYAIIEKIGEGGFGAVYLAEQHHPVRRRVALKLIKLGMDTKRVIARFNAERQALAMMDHPNIAKVLEASATDTGRPYFVMELVEGIPITRYCNEQKLSIKQRLELFIQVCQAVQHAHTKGIIHRDLKPSNILITLQDGEAVPKVIDFGIAKATQGRLTEQSYSTDQAHWLGTPQYMSPEQADGGSDIDTRTNVYSLGVVLYELLCGSAPFDFKSSGYSEIQRTIREVDPPPPSSKTVHRELRGDLDQIVLEAMDKDRRRRYETASALAADIQRYLNNEPVTARHAGRIYRFRKLVRRNRLAFAAAAAVAIALATGLITSTALYVKARNAKATESVLRENAEAKAYASDMLAIQQSVSVNNYGRALMLLDRHRPKRGEKDRRGWEWRYLWQQCQSDSSALLCRRQSPVSALAVSADDQYCAIGQSGPQGVSVWDLRTRTQLPGPPADAEDIQVAFSPTEPLLAYTLGSWDGDGRARARLHLWDVKTARLIVGRDLNDVCQGLAFSRDGKTLLTSAAGEQGRFTFWRVPELTERRRVAAPNLYWRSNFAVTRDMTAVAFTSDFARPGVVGSNLRVIDLRTGKEWSEGVAADCVAFSPDGRVLALGTWPNAGTGADILLRDVATGKPIGQPLRGNLGWVRDLVFWPDGKTLASTGADQLIRLWDISDPDHGQPIGRPLRGHRQEVSRLVLLADGKTLVSGGKDGSVYLWDTSAVPPDRTRPAKFRAMNWNFDTQGGAVLSVDNDGHVVRHEGRDLGTIVPVLYTRAGVVGAYFFRGRLLIAHYDDNTIDVWNLQDRKRLFTMPAEDADVPYSTLTPDGHWAAYFKAQNVVREWDLETGRELASWRTPGGLNALAFTPNGRLRLSLAENRSGLLRQVPEGKQSAVELDLLGIVDTCFSRNGEWIAIASQSASVGLWKTEDLTRPHAPAAFRLGENMLACQSVAFSPEDERLAVGGQGSEAVKLYDTDSRQEVLTLPAGGSAFKGTRFSSDGTLIGARTGHEWHVWRAPTLAEIDAGDRTR